MKKLYSLLLAALAINAATAQDYYDYTTDDDFYKYGGFQALAISPNGNFSCGATYSTYGFVYDYANDKVFVPTENESGTVITDGGCQLLDINDEGFAIGFDDNGGVMVGADGSYKVLGRGIMQKMTPDASIIVGCSIVEGYQVAACYWENGERIMLDTPTSEEMGFKVNGSRAISISDDGSVILGWLQDRGAAYPMVLWFRQEDGSYKIDPVCKGKFEPYVAFKYDPDGFRVGMETGPNPYLEYQPGALTPDGKYVAMYICENDGNMNMPLKLGLYSIESGELEIMEDNKGLFNYYDSFIITGITNDCKIVGSAGQMADGPTPFVFDNNTKVIKPINEAIPALKSVLDPIVENSQVLGLPMFISAITPDGKYMSGYYCKEFMGMVLTSSFVIETGFDAAGVESVGVELDGKTRVYNLEGVYMGDKIDGLPAGIYIVNGKKFILR